MKKINGFAPLLGLLIVIAIGAMIYFLDFKAIFGVASQGYKPPTDQDQPWELESLLVPEGQNVIAPKKGQPELLEPYLLMGSIRRNDAQRGDISIHFFKNCRIESAWTDKHVSDKKTVELSASLKGNIASNRFYSDDNGTDKTRLFFYAKGTYTQTTALPDNTVQTEQGVCYLMGWLRTDYSAQGTLTITTDQSWSAVYNFQASRQSAVPK